MLSRKGPVALLGQLLDDRLIDVLPLCVKLGRENGETADPQALQQLLEHSNVEAAVVYHRGNDHEFKCVDVLLRNLNVLRADHKTLQLLVGFLLLGDRKQIVAAVDAEDVMEALVLEVFARETLAAADLEDLRRERILAAESFDHLSTDLRREPGLNEVFLAARADAVEVHAQRVLREDLERPLLVLPRFLVLRFLGLVSEDLTEVSDRLPESLLVHR